MEDEYPFFEYEQLEQLAVLYPDINQLAYICCRMKAKVDKIKVGPIEIESNSQMWLDLADTFYNMWRTSGTNGKGRSITGKTVGRADEY